RSVALEEPVQSQWPPILIETANDNVGAKMNALVNRGSPRDFVDIKQVVDSGLSNIGQCWELWRRKNPSEQVIPARQKILAHLAALEARRPLSSIANEQDRTSAAQLRDWYKNQFARS